MGDWDYGRENGLWGNDGIPYGIDDYEPSYRKRNSGRRNYYKNSMQSEIRSYVELMKGLGITTIVGMNKYLSNNNMWDKFDSIKRMNTYASGYSSIGISKDAYKEIMSLCKTNDVITSHLISQDKVN